MIYSTNMKEYNEMNQESEAERNRDTVRIELCSRPENEAFARGAVSAFIARMDPNLEELNDVKTAVSEAVTNSIIHGYPEREGLIILEASILGEELTITVIDYGVGIENIPQALEPMYSGDPKKERSGMGFSFMEVFMDSLCVESKPGRGTTVKMTKVITGKRH